MTAARYMIDTWRGMIAALVVSLLVMAPLAAQAKMAHHAANIARTVEHTSHSHDGHSGTAMAAHHHDHAVAHDRVPTKSSQKHDHRSHHDGSCCGTYCHSACTADIVETMLPIALTTAYATFTPVSLAAVAPDQPQRPPSIPLSI